MRTGRRRRRGLWYRSWQLGGQFAFQAIDELAEELLRHLGDHGVPELGDLAGDLQVGIYRDNGTFAIGTK